MQMPETDAQECLFGQDFSYGKTSPALSPAGSRRAKTSVSSWKRSSELVAAPYQFLDLTPGHGNLLGESYWEDRSPYVGESLTLNTGVSPKDAVESSLSQILEGSPLSKYYLSKTACLGILRRASERGKELPPQLKTALMMQAGLTPIQENYHDVIAFAANQRDEVRDLHDIASALGAQPGMKQQTFVTAGVVTKGNGECFLAPEKNTSLTGGGGQAGQGYPCVITAELDAENCLTPWDTQQARIFTPEGKAPTMAGADGGGGRNPVGLLFSAAFNAGAGPRAGGIGFMEESAPTLKASDSGTNMVPAVLCLNDQGGKRMEANEDVSGTLRSQEHGHQPLVLATQQGGAEIGVDLCPTITASAGMSGNNQPVLFENHGIDSRYTGPHPVAPTMSARYGTGGNNVPLIGQEEPALCIMGNAIDRQPQNGGNGIGYQPELAYTLTATDHHAVFSRKRVDVFKDDDIASTESARQHKDATDLVLQQTVGALTSSDRKGPNSQYVSQDKCIVEGPHLIRRLTPLECERLQGFPDDWTDIPGASDSARYKALGNSVAIPCVRYVLCGVANQYHNRRSKSQMAAYQARASPCFMSHE